MADFRDTFSQFANRAVQVTRTNVLDEDGNYIFDKTASGEERRTSYCFTPEDPLVADILAATLASGAQLRVVFADAKGRETPLTNPRAGQHVMTVRESAQGGWVIDPRLRTLG